MSFNLLPLFSLFKLALKYKDSRDVSISRWHICCYSLDMTLTNQPTLTNLDFKNFIIDKL